MFFAIMRAGFATAGRGWDDGLDAGPGEVCADGTGVMAFVGEQRFGPAGQHPERRLKAFHVVSLPRRGEDAQAAVAAGVHRGREAAS
jgi:hypothetical protein